MNQYDRYVPSRFKKAEIAPDMSHLGVPGVWFRPIRGNDVWYAFGPYKTIKSAEIGARKRGLKLVTK